jgi:hypothetical protein
MARRPEPSAFAKATARPSPPSGNAPRLLAALALAQRAGGRMFRGCRRLFLWLGREQQGMALASARIRRVRCLGFRYILRVDGNDTHAAPMCGDHNPQGLILAHAKFRLQNHDDELAGRKVVIDQNDLWRRGRSTFISSLVRGLMMISLIVGAVPDCGASG